jgi:hypothetical protein
MRKPAVIGAVAVALFLVYIIYSSMQVAQVTCEVCITFRGTTQCRTAVGANAQEAETTAISTACAVLGGNMAEDIACQNTRPSKLMCTGP